MIDYTHSHKFTSPKHNDAEFTLTCKQIPIYGDYKWELVCEINNLVIKDSGVASISNPQFSQIERDIEGFLVAAATWKKAELPFSKPSPSEMAEDARIILMNLYLPWMESED